MGEDGRRKASVGGSLGPETIPGDFYDPRAPLPAGSPRREGKAPSRPPITEVWRAMEANG